MQNELVEFIRMICVDSILEQQLYSVNWKIICALYAELQQISNLLINLQNVLSLVFLKKFVPIWGVNFNISFSLV